MCEETFLILYLEEMTTINLEPSSMFEYRTSRDQLIYDLTEVVIMQQSLPQLIRMLFNIVHRHLDYGTICNNLKTLMLFIVNNSQRFLMFDDLYSKNKNN